MQIIFDTKGTIFFQGSGFPEPVGELGHLKEIDMSTGKPVPKFEPYPKSEMEILKEQVAELQAQNAALIEGAQIGGTV